MIQSCCGRSPTTSWFSSNVSGYCRFPSRSISYAAGLRINRLRRMVWQPLRQCHLAPSIVCRTPAGMRVSALVQLHQPVPGTWEGWGRHRDELDEQWRSKGGGPGWWVWQAHPKAGFRGRHSQDGLLLADWVTSDHSLTSWLVPVQPSPVNGHAESTVSRPVTS